MKSKLLIAGLALMAGTNLCAQSLQLNDLEYFEERGVNYLVYSNRYNGMFCDEKTAAIEIILRGVRIATGGGIRLMNTPEQWDVYPVLESRTVNRDKQQIEVVLDYQQYGFKPTVRVTAKDRGVTMAVYLDQPVPAELIDKAGMNIEFFPATYFGKTYLMDGRPQILPKHPASETEMHPRSEQITQIYGKVDGLTTFNDRCRDEFIVPRPIAQGHNLVFAPEDDNLRVTFRSDDLLNLFDGRNLSNNGTYVVRTLLPEGKTGKVAEWYIESSYDAAWFREPNIGISQVGYTPGQQKRAVLELDKNDPLAATAKVVKISADGTQQTVLEPKVEEWGVYNNRYNYACVDFSAIQEQGIYYIEYKGTRTNPFPVDYSVYADKWHTTMDVWLPVQMDHMEVKEGYRTWHSRSNMDDALQAPTNFQMHDGYRQGPETFTQYKPWEHIPNLGVGAWYDAGDFDIQAGTVVGLTHELADLWESFGVDRDQTFIDQQTQFVDLHRPDGTPDVLQQVEHGLLNIMAQVENIGFVAQGIVQVNMWQYVHIGDGGAQTDGLLYNPSLRPYQIYGQTSGTRDDRVAFTSNFTPQGTMSTIASLAAAARVLRDTKPELADRAMRDARMLWEKYFDQADPELPQNKRVRAWGVMRDGRIDAAIQMWRTTGDDRYKDFFLPRVIEMLQPREERPSTVTGNAADFFMIHTDITPALELCPLLPKEKKLQEALRKAIPDYVERAKQMAASNPYGVPVTGRGWGGTEIAMNWAYNNYLVWRNFPDMIDPELVLNGMHFIFGRHPYSNVSFITSVGVNTKKVAYGNNRADYTVIPGGIAPGLLMMLPDYFEHKDDYPFLWGENECCTRNVAEFVKLTLGAEQITQQMQK